MNWIVKRLFVTTLALLALDGWRVVPSTVAQTLGDLCDDGCQTDDECTPGLLCSLGYQDELFNVGLDRIKAACNIVTTVDSVCFTDSLIQPLGECESGCQNADGCATGLLCSSDYPTELVNVGLDAVKADCIISGTVASVCFVETLIDPLGRCEPGCTSDDACDIGLLCSIDYQTELSNVGLDPFKADCNIQTTVGSVCFTETLIDPLDRCDPGCNNDFGCAIGLLCSKGYQTQLANVGLDSFKADCAIAGNVDSVCFAENLIEPLEECEAGCTNNDGCAVDLLCSTEYGTELFNVGLHRMHADCVVGTAVTSVCFTASRIAPLARCDTGCQNDAGCGIGLLCSKSYQTELLNVGQDRFRADCNVPSDVTSVCFSASLIQPNSNGGGDPHFRTYDGTKYSFHGQCDLVMVHTPRMGSLGVPLTIHARTTITTSWSYISQAALQIGSDTIEITETGQHYFNGKSDIPLSHVLLMGRYPITKTEKNKAEPISRKNPTLVNRTRIAYHIQLDDIGGTIEISRYKNMLGVKVKALLPNSRGMLGVLGIPGLIGRDGISVLKDANTMGMEWQVRDDEPQLFYQDMTRAPQYPEKCILPTVQGRRRTLRSKSEYYQAKNLCATIPDIDEQEFCIEDILLTGDYGMVHAYDSD